MKKIDRRFATHPLDLTAMQQSAEAVCASIERLVAEAVSRGSVDGVLLRSALVTLMHTSARAQEEYAEIARGEPSLPAVWTKVAFD